jgi:hypothetical protein
MELDMQKDVDRKTLTAPALRTFFKITDGWALKPNQQMRILGLTSRLTLHSWKQGKVDCISKDALERISYIFGIYKNLELLLPESAGEWIHKPNDAGVFGGRTALQRMMSGNVADLYVIKQYLDTQTV